MINSFMLVASANIYSNPISLECIIGYSNDLSIPIRINHQFGLLTKFRIISHKIIIFVAMS